MQQRPLPLFLLSFFIINIGFFIICGNCNAEPHNITIIDSDKSSLTLTELIPELVNKRAVFVGEQHDRYDHHLNQLTIIRQLHEHNPHWVIGLEFFQQPFQQHLDNYISGVIDEREFLLKTEYFERWGYDYRLYRDIFRYAREQGIPMLALNIAQEISSKVAQVGIEGLDANQRIQIPQDIDKSDEKYRDHLQEIFQLHQRAESKNFEYFWETQLVWDESMAQRTADYLQAHPDKSMVVLAGAGHIAHGSGIPNRLKRRLPIEMALLLPTDNANEDQQGADYSLLSKNIELPASGKMGVMLDLTEGVSAKDILAGSAAEMAGMQNNDQILSIADQPVKWFTDVRLALMDKIPGDKVTVIVRRDNGPEKLMLPLEIILQE